MTSYVNSNTRGRQVAVSHISKVTWFVAFVVGCVCKLIIIGGKASLNIADDYTAQPEFGDHKLASGDDCRLTGAIDFHYK